MNRIIFAILLVGAFVLCCCHSPERPKNIMGKDEMVNWMIKIYLAEARISRIGVYPDSSYRLFLPYQDSLMRQYSLTDSLLMKSYEYYLEHPVEMEQIYDAIIDSLSLQEQRLRDSPNFRQRNDSSRRPGRAHRV